MRQLIRSLQRMLGIQIRYRLIRVNELPVTVAEKHFYLVGDDQVDWLGALRCPCGCSDTIQLSLAAGKGPSWRVSIDLADLPTLTPSVNRTVGCKSHFFLRNGRIVWCSSR